MKPSFVEFCPVPKEQQPVNEYEQLKESWFFSWPTLSNFHYLKKLAWIGFWGLFIATPISAASFPPQKALFQLILSSMGGAGLFVVFVLIRLYLGWSYISSRLNDEQVTYEESGWYDGQVWPKPPAILERDRLIVRYQIQPILTRLQKTGLMIAILVAIGSLIWFFI